MSLPEDEPEPGEHEECAFAIHELQGQLAAVKAELDFVLANDIKATIATQGREIAKQRDAARAGVDRLRAALMLIGSEVETARIERSLPPSATDWLERMIADALEMKT